MANAKRKPRGKHRRTQAKRSRTHEIVKTASRRELVRQSYQELNLSNAVEQVLIQGDLAKLTPEERMQYYKAMCSTLGLNPLSQPFDYLLFREGEGAPAVLKLYANKSCTEQLRKIHGVGVRPPLRKVMTEDTIMVEADVFEPRTGRTDTATGVVSLYKLKNGVRVNYTGPELCNAIMKCETKAKRRATLSICGLAILDASELDTMEVVGGVTREGRIFEYPQIAETTGSHEAAQEVARQKIEAHNKGLAAGTEEKRKATPTSAPVGQQEPEAAKKTDDLQTAIDRNVELDWTDEASPIVRGDIANLTPLLEQHCMAKWDGSWWRIPPAKAEVLRQMCEQLSFRLTEVMPKTSSAETKPSRPGSSPSAGNTTTLGTAKKPSSEGPASPSVVVGTIQHFTEKMTKGGTKRPSTPYLNVLLKTDSGDRWYSVFDRDLFEFLSKGKGKQGEFFVEKRGEYHNLVGIKVLAGKEFEDGKVPVVQNKDREAGSGKLW